MTTMNAGNVAIERVDVEVTAELPNGWTMDELWDALVEAGNDPKQMTRNADTVTVFMTKEAVDG